MKSTARRDGSRKGREQRAAVKLAVYRAGNDAEKHLARLRRAGRFTVTCFSARRTLTTLSPTAYDGVLWELSPGHQPDRRHVAAMARRMPILSYSAARGRDLSDLSRRLGFTTHLRAPLSPADLDGHLAQAGRGEVARVDLFTRIRRTQRALHAQLAGRETLLDMMRAANSTLEPRKIAEVLLDRMSSWFPTSSWAVVAMHEPSEIATLADRGLSTMLESGLKDVAHWIMAHGEEFISADLAQDRRVRARAEVSVVGLPLECRGRTLGAVIAAEPGSSADGLRLTPGLRSALRAVLEPPSFALDNALTLQRAEALSVTDDLTQLYNSRYLNLVLRRETKRASRSGRPLSLLFMDLDGFKSINDSHGHLFGSRALIEAAEVVRLSARETDICARFGGDEFAVVLPDTGGEGAYAVGERIRERIAAHSFLAGDGLHIRLTASVGVATLPDVAASADELLKAADRAMYRVKDAGKNGILVALENGVAASYEEQ
jgi:diguanylate cyclase (GGDEF)-like protein